MVHGLGAVYLLDSWLGGGRGEPSGRGSLEAADVEGVKCGRGQIPSGAAPCRNDMASAVERVPPRFASAKQPKRLCLHTERGGFRHFVGAGHPRHVPRAAGWVGILQNVDCRSRGWAGS